MYTADFIEFKKQLSKFFDGHDIIDSYSKRYALGTDASFYRLVPKLILRVNNKLQMQQVLALASQCSIAVTFRAAGTSLSGQAITDSVLIILSDAWQNAEITDQGNKICLQPGIVGAKVNQLLKPYSRKIGPDPASIDSCKIGGIAANNASGMCCGVKQNSYHTVADMTIIFADGTQLNTACQQSCNDFIHQQPALIKKLHTLLSKVKSNPNLSQLIRQKYRLKNTCGYGINSLLDFDDPIQVIKHLMIGSEGTLGFIADITYNTVEVHHHKLTGFYVFEHLNDACLLVSKLSRLNVAAVELLDYRALKSVSDKPLLSPCVNNLTLSSAALLIEIQASDAQSLEAINQQVLTLLSALKDSINYQVAFTEDEQTSSDLWQIRKAIFPAVGAVRQTGSTVIIEDIAFPIEKLTMGVTELQRLFVKYHYNEAIIFGHALDGNLHFVFTQSFDSNTEKQRYADFMDDVTQLVAVRFSGSLKAEHGTGRNMAPFVQLEWGNDAYQLMQEVKQTFDPDNILNPGVIINNNDHAHLENLKQLPAADSIIDKCIECGFCESVCPSTEYTFTPRQRITVWRRIMELSQMLSSEKGNKDLQQEYDSLQQDYQFLGIDSCAATGLCGLKCPVNINTGDFIKSLRAQKFNHKTLSNLAANNLDKALSVAKLGLSTVAIAKKVLPEIAIKKGFEGLNKISGQRIPLYYPAWPKGELPLVKTQQSFSNTNINKLVIYLPSCSTRVFAQDSKAQDQRPLSNVVQSVLSKAGYKVIIPENINSLCCGMPFASKGDTYNATYKLTELTNALKPLTHGGDIPVILDASSCAFQFISQNNENIKAFELADFIAQFALPKLQIIQQEQPITLHITCSSKRNKSDDKLLKIAQVCSKKVIIPNDIYCCGFAGDKGFVLPQLNESALKPLKAQVNNIVEEGFSNNRTCEIGLTKATAIPYQSIVYLLDKVSSPI